MTRDRIGYVELPVSDTAASRDFFARAFGWSFADFAPTYSATTNGDVDVGLQADSSERTRAPLAIVKSSDLEASLGAVERAGGEITRPIFAFPGGRRFHFREPGGNELAVWSEG